jgi:hypothetical protein
MEKVTAKNPEMQDEIEEYNHSNYEEDNFDSQYDVSNACNLIVNYLPHDVDDFTLRVIMVIYN